MTLNALLFHTGARKVLLFSGVFLAFHSFYSGVQAQNISVEGELKKWHPVTLTIDGPTADEAGQENPFLDFRLEVTFTQGATSVVVPGYFAADGNAAETGATSGSKWRVHFVPRSTGTWSYTVSMRSGSNVAVNANPTAGSPTPQNGSTGSFSVAETDKGGDDFRGKGVLSYVGEHYLRFDNGDYFIKGGADSPENFLGYYEFDNTIDVGCRDNNLTNGLHRYSAHVSDWKTGDPVWHGSKGKGIIGALNYLASKRINSVYFLTMNTKGDGCEVNPWTLYGNHADHRVRYDVSKLAQWDIVFSHMDELGIMLHIVTQEQENDQLMDGGALGNERKLYYRELMARFGYHLGITWNLGEENTNTASQRIQFGDYISGIDPYGHLVVFHTYPSQIEDVYNGLLGYPNGSPAQSITGNSMQRQLGNGIHSDALKWRERSSQKGHPWVVMLDEVGPGKTGATPDGPGNNHKELRQRALWATLMAGGAGVEWYFGYDNPHDDLDMEDWRSRDQLWDYTVHAVSFFQDYLPFTEMEPADDLIGGNNDYVFAKSGDTYAVYLLNAQSAGTITLPAGSYTVRWFNPRSGILSTGSIATLDGTPPFDLGAPSSEQSEDWAVLIQAEDLAARPPDNPLNTAPGLQYAYYKGSWTSMPDYASMSPHDVGVVTNIDLSPRDQDDDFGFEFKGFVQAPETGTYTFYTNSDDGSRLFVGSQLVVENDGVHQATEQQGSIILEAGLHAICIQYFESDGEETLSVSWKPPGASKRTIQNNEWVYDLDNSLPVELALFTGVMDGASAYLTWQTLSELNNAGFHVERSKSIEGPFASIAFVEGAGTTSEVQDYTFTDEAIPSSASWVYYRLRQVDFDGSFDYSDTVSLQPRLTATLLLHPNYPNPFNPTTTLSFDLPAESHVRLAVYETSGRLVAILVDRPMPGGLHRVSFEAASGLASGTYVYRLDTPVYSRSGKMLLLK